jgi:mannose-6-phosphate isomerase-like protein (cupin superfamily)
MESFMVGKSGELEAHKKGVIEVRHLLSEMMSKDVSVALINLDGTNKKTLNQTRQAFYYVLKGEGVFNIDDKDNPVTEGDFVLIEPGTAYYDRGKMELLAVFTPRFDQNDVKYLD